ncbi:hypothetical protein [Burkholderia multivorans]|nr:hypothetical protein [Burkholderia multivorans]
MNYQTKNQLGLVVVAFPACVIVVVAAKGGAIDTIASVLGHLHAQQQ